MSDLTIRTDGATMFAEAPKQETPKANVNSPLSENRFEDSHKEFNVGSQPSPMNARTLTGRPMPSLNGCDPSKVVVNVDGIETTLANAIQTGFIQQNPDGSYGRTPAAPKAAPKAAEPVHRMVSQTGGKHVERLVQATGNRQYAENLIVKSIAAATSEKGMDASVISEVANALRTTPDAATDLVNAVMTDMVSNTAAVLQSSFGVDGMEALKYFIENRPSDAAKALNSLFHGYHVAEIMAKIANHYRLKK